ncbi:alpha/beta hydrolase [Solimonas variicoloris]|uniref:alpha/beta hydrolase n=1 Tax=Solimonas variicoloris TaxID=254408 RepID=UPI0003A5A5A9|nr:alpha/beta fold hydrolase [Solimonas variicoloris]
MATQPLTASPVDSSVKSTIVRSKTRSQPFLRPTFRILDRLAPTLAARLAQRLFFTPPRAVLREEEREILDAGRRGTIEHRGDRLAIWRWGEGPRALLVHGWGGHAGQMTALVEPLVAAGYEVVAVDLPGHGLSSGDRASVRHFADAIAHVAQGLGGIDALIAHSLGSAGSTLALSRGLAVRRAVFFAPPARFDAIWARFRGGLGMSAATWTRFQRRAEAWLGLTFAEIAPADLAPDLRVPLLVIHGTGDREVSLQEGELLQRRWPLARLHRAEGLGHLRVLKDAACIDAARHFLAASQR